MEDLVKQDDQPTADPMPVSEQVQGDAVDQGAAGDPVSEAVLPSEQPEAVADTDVVDVIPAAEPMVEDQAESVKEESDLAVPEVKGEPKWYIVQTLTGQEDRVKTRIETTVEELGLKDRILRVLVPEEETVEIRGDKRVERKRKMYPGYVFVEMILDEDTWYKIRSTAGVARFIGGKTSPVPVTDREMQRVLKQLGIKEKEITVEFSVGEPVRIISGSFRGYTGSVSEVNPTKSKLKAMINIFGRDTSVEVDFDRVEKVV